MLSPERGYNKYVPFILLVVPLVVFITGFNVREQVDVSGEAKPRLMTAIAAKDFGANWSDFSQLFIVHVPIPPDPPPDRIRVRNFASSLTPHDQQYATEYGLYGPPIGPFGPYNYGPGFIPGVNYAGLVDANGGGPECAHLGDGPGGIRVFGSTTEECLAEYCNVFCKFAAPVPNGLDLITAASLPDVTMTAVSAYKIAGAPWIPANGSDFTVAISSGAGGTGTLAIQLARIYGATKVYTVASRKNHEYLRSLGATDVFDYHETALWEALPEASVDVFYDNRGNTGFCKACAPDHVETATKFIKPGGYYLYLPSAEETEQVIFPVPHPLVKQVFLVLPIPDVTYQDLEYVGYLMAKGKIKPMISRVYHGFEQFFGAMNELAAGHVRGKLALDFTGGH